MLPRSPSQPTNNRLCSELSVDLPDKKLPSSLGNGNEPEILSSALVMLEQGLPPLEPSLPITEPHDMFARCIQTEAAVAEKEFSLGISSIAVPPQSVSSDKAELIIAPTTFLGVTPESAIQSQVRFDGVA